MQRWSLVISLCSVILLLGSSFLQRPASAVTLQAILNPDKNHTVLEYNELHTVLVNYPKDSKVAQLFSKAMPKISVNASTFVDSNKVKGNQEAMNRLLASVNREMAKKNTLVRAGSVNMTFIAEVKRYSDTSSIVAQRLYLDIGIDGYVIPNDKDTQHKYLDFNWRDITVSDPVILQYIKEGDNSSNSNSDSNHTGNIEINLMSDVLDALMPGFNAALGEAGAGEKEMAYLHRPVIDFSKLSTSMDRWYVLFDPTASIQETERFKFKGEENGAKVVTIYSLGEGSFREGAHNDEVITTSFGLDGNKNNNNDARYSMQFTIPAPNGRIDVLGYSKMTSVNGQDTAIISSKNEGGSSYAGNFPIVVLGSLGGIMAAVVSFVLLKSRTPKGHNNDNDDANR